MWHDLQTKGTTMSKKFAPAYANIYMGEWEETVQRAGQSKCSKNPIPSFILMKLTSK